MSTVKERLENVRRAIAQSGRDPRSVTIVGVAKKQPVATVSEGIAAGLVALGNNYVQEGQQLRDALGNPPGIEWHFIGHIQSRKAKQLIDYAWIDSLDRVEVAQELDRRLAAAGRRADALIEINVGGEATKSGIAPGTLTEFLEATAKLGHLRVRGLMGMPPPLEPVESRRPHFRELKRLFDLHRDRFGLDTLSMGTSADFLVAVQEGATVIRLGTTLFGERG